MIIKHIINILFGWYNISQQNRGIKLGDVQKNLNTLVFYTKYICSGLNNNIPKETLMNQFLEPVRTLIYFKRIFIDVTKLRMLRCGNYFRLPEWDLKMMTEVLVKKISWRTT